MAPSSQDTPGKSLTPQDETRVLRALPAQFVDLPDAVIIKRGAGEVRVSGGGAGALVRVLYELAAEGISVANLRQRFDDSTWLEVETLINSLRARRFLVEADGSTPVPEDHADIFYWQFGTSASDVAERLRSLRIVIVGVNYISRRLASALLECGAENLEVVNYPLLCNLRMVNDDGTPKGWPSELRPLDYGEWLERADQSGARLMIASTDFGGRELLREWNRFAVDRKIPFLPVALENLIGQVGPLVVPGESPCYECLRGRENSHLTDPKMQRAFEAEGFVGQRVAGFHPSMATILGDVAAIEIGRVYGGWNPGGAVGRVLEINLLTGAMTPRRLLKLPRCPVCGPADRRSSVATTRAEFRGGLTMNQPHSHDAE